MERGRVLYIFIGLIPRRILLYSFWSIFGFQALEVLPVPTFVTIVQYS